MINVLKEELLACPFCGESAVIEATSFWDSSELNYRVICGKGHSLDWWETNEIEAIKLWNTRAFDMQRLKTDTTSIVDAITCIEVDESYEVDMEDIIRRIKKLSI